jgi:hypothetical protein
MNTLFVAMNLLDDEMAISPESEEVKRLEKSLKVSIRVIKSAQTLFFLIGGLLLFRTLRTFWLMGSISSFGLLLSLVYLGIGIFIKFRPKLGLITGLIIFLTEMIFITGQYTSIAIAPVLLIYAGFGIYSVFKMENTIIQLEKYGIDTRKYESRTK